MPSPPAKKMNPVLLWLGLLLSLGSREVGAQNTGGKGNLATSLCAELIIPNDYNCIEYQAVTDDGFIVGMQNMPSPRGLGSAESGGPPVLLQHGLNSGGESWVVNSPQESLAFVLADAGFDVWITNTRAIQWSHGHQHLTKSDSAYWAWTYDELACYDLKTFTEFIYNKRGGRKLLYIGHSLGTTILFAGLTGGRFRTTILGYLNAAVMLAPFAFPTSLTAVLLRASFETYSSPLVYLAGADQYSAYLANELVCGLPSSDPLVCYASFTAAIGESSYTNQSRLGFYARYTPQCTSTYNMNHIGQGLTRNNFAFYDKGADDNQASYGQSSAPDYDLTMFPATLPMQYWMGGIDGVSDPTDVATVLGLLPSSNREVHNLANYGHSDFTLGYNAYVDVYPSIVRFLNKHS